MGTGRVAWDPVAVGRLLAFAVSEKGAPVGLGVGGRRCCAG